MRSPREQCENLQSVSFIDSSRDDLHSACSHELLLLDINLWFKRRRFRLSKQICNHQLVVERYFRSFMSCEYTLTENVCGARMSVCIYELWLSEHCRINKMRLHFTWQWCKKLVENVVGPKLYHRAGKKRQLCILRSTTSATKQNHRFFFPMQHAYTRRQQHYYVRENLFILPLMFVNTAWKCQPLSMTKSSCLLSRSVLGVRTAAPGDTCESFVLMTCKRKKSLLSRPSCCVIETR